MTAPPVAAPQTPKEWEEYLNTTCETIEAANNALMDGSFQANLTGYLESRNKVMTDLRAQMAEQGQLAVHQMLENAGVPRQQRIDIAGQAAARAIADGLYYNPDAPAAFMNGAFKNSGEFFSTAIKAQRQDPQAKARLYSIQGYSEHVPDEGGVLVPEEVRSDILTRSLETALVRPKAQVIPMPSGKMKYPAVDFTTEVGEVYGGIVAYWVDEGEEIPDTSAKFGMITLDTNKLACRAAPPNELVRHVPAFVAWLNQNLPNAMGHFEDLAFLKANGVGKPLGQLHEDNPSLITISKEVGQPANTITWVNILAMVARMLPESLMRADWVVTMDALPELMTMALPVGVGGSAVMAIDASKAGPQTLFGRPITWSRKAPGVLGTKGDISLTDLSTYVIGDTLTMRMESSQHELFSRDKTVFRAIQEMDGQPQLLSALTPENGGPTLSATVQIETRA
ncbi:MAG TPA: phage major capsid protein [Propionibacteriaceae bacterium]|nr:phage major capsid protein [Propionibacteriaceae bacterium]